MTATATALEIDNATNVACTESADTAGTNAIKRLMGVSDEFRSALPEDPVAHVATLSNEELFPLGERALRDIADDLVILCEIRQRFYAAKGIHILGYGSFKDFVQKNSAYSIRTIQRRLNEARPKDESKINDRYKEPIKPATPTATTIIWNRTIGNQNMFEVLAALQGEIRRGMEYEATQHALQMEGQRAHRTGVWNRLTVIAAEDIGLANVDAAARIKEWREIYEGLANNNNPQKPETLYLVLAVTYLCRSPKSRIVDNLINTVVNEERLPPAPTIDVSDCHVPEMEITPIPDFCIDKHSYKGKAQNRGAKHFYDEKAKLDNCSLKDDWREPARSAAIAVDNAANENRLERCK